MAEVPSTEASRALRAEEQVDTAETIARIVRVLHAKCRVIVEK